MYVGSKERIHELVPLLKVYTVNGLKKLLKYAFLDVFDAMPTVDTSGYTAGGKKAACPVTDGLMQEAVKSTSLSFSEIALAAASFLSDSRNIEEMVKQMPEQDKKYLSAIIRRGELYLDDVKQFYPKADAELVKEYNIFAWGGTAAIRRQSYLTYISYYNLGHHTFDMPAVIREVLAPHLIPELRQPPKACDEVPEGLTVFSDEEGALHAFRQLDILVEGKIYDLSKLKPAATDIKKLSATMELKEFFPADTHNKFAQLARGRIIAGILVKPWDLKKMSKLKACDRIKSMFSNNDEYFGLERYALLPQLSGSFASYHGHAFDNGIHGLRISFVQLLRRKDVGHGKWNDFEDTANFVQFALPDFVSTLSEQWKYKLNIKQGDGNRERIEVPLRESSKYVDIPLLEATVFMLAALGMAEIAFDSSRYDVTSPFAGIRYWRFTPLAHYVFGDTDTYDEKADKLGRASFELDSRLLMIRMTGESKALGGILAKFGQALSTKRYIVSEKSFLADCENIDDLNDKITLFRKFVTKEPPANWEKFFHTMTENCSALTKEKTAYKVLRINAGDTALKKLITGDKVIREKVILAEGNRILVANKDYDDFRLLMRARGYLF